MVSGNVWEIYNWALLMYVHVNIPFSAIFLSLAQAGIVSFGTLSCGNDDPTVYTRVDAYLDWIEEKLRE